MTILLAFHRRYYCDDNVNVRACNFFIQAETEVSILPTVREYGYLIIAVYEIKTFLSKICLQQKTQKNKNIKIYS